VSVVSQSSIMHVSLSFRFVQAEKYNISSKEQRSASIVFAFAPFDYVSVEDQRNKRTLLIGQVVRSKQSSSRVILSLFVHPV